jgi:hypothetical protein
MLLALSFLTCQMIRAQKFDPNNMKVKNLKMDYAVPDLPAFTMLQSESTNLLRPSTFKELSVITDQLFSGSSMVIPKSFAIEIAPIVLLKENNLTIQDYQKNPAWYNSRISVGSLRDSLNISKVAIGFRTTLIDKGDIKRKNNFEGLCNKLKKRSEVRVEILTEELDKIGKLYQDYTDDPEVKKMVDNQIAMRLINSDDIKTFQDKEWNEERLDIAFAFAGSSPDSLAENIKFNSVSGWVTYAHPLKEKGQFVVCGNFNVTNNDGKNYFELSIPARVYFGTNELKMYAEGQYTYKGLTKLNTLLVDFGCEYYLANGFWLNFSAGYENDYSNKTSKLVSNFKIIYAIPGNLN